MDTKIVKKKSKLKFVLIIIASAVAVSIFGWYFLNQKKTYNVKSEDITIDEVTNGKFEDVAKAEERAEKKAASNAKKSSKREETPAIQNQAASTTLGDIDALAALKEQLENKKK